MLISNKKHAFNEQVKLFANALNNLAVAAIVTGIIAPSWSGGPLHNHYLFIALSGWFLGFILHMIALNTLNKLKE